MEVDDPVGAIGIGANQAKKRGMDSKDVLCPLRVESRLPRACRDHRPVAGEAPVTARLGIGQIALQLVPPEFLAIDGSVPAGLRYALRPPTAPEEAMDVDA